MFAWQSGMGSQKRPLQPRPNMKKNDRTIEGTLRLLVIAGADGPEGKQRPINTGDRLRSSAQQGRTPPRRSCCYSKTVRSLALSEVLPEVGVRRKPSECTRNQSPKLWWECDLASSGKTSLTEIIEQRKDVGLQCPCRGPPCL